MGLYWDNGKENGNYYYGVQGLGLILKTMGPFLAIDYVTAFNIWGVPKEDSFLGSRSHV